MRLEWYGPEGVRLVSNDVTEELCMDDGKLACGAGHSLMIVPNANGSVNQVLSFGNNDQSQLGRGVELDHSLQPSPVLGVTSSVLRVAAGEAHSVAVDVEGKVWSWGGSALVRGRQGPASIPMKISKGLEDSGIFITSIACGAEHTMATDREGRIYAWGCCEGGRAGLRFSEKSSENNLIRPRTVELPAGVCAMSVACGREHSVILTSDLRVFSAGKSPANGMDMECDRFQAIESLCSRRQVDPVTLIACGDFHTIVSTAKQIMTFGDGSCGKLGHGSEDDSHIPTAIDFHGKQFGASQIAAGRHHSMVLCENGGLWCFGLDHVIHEFFIDDRALNWLPSKRAPSTIALPKMLVKPAFATAIHNKVVQIACGSTFALMVTDTNSPQEQPVETEKDDVVEETSWLDVLNHRAKAETRPFSPRVSATLLSDDQHYKLTIATLSRLLRDQETKNSELRQQLDEALGKLNQLPVEYRLDPKTLVEEVLALRAQIAARSLT